MSTHEVVLPLFSPAGALSGNKPVKQYRCIVADPPWNYADHLGDGPKGPSAQYPTMRLHEVMNMPVGLWAMDDCHLYLWTTNTFLEDSYKVAKAWGFEPRTVITWIKGRVEHNRLIQHIGTGYHFRNSTEHVLFAVRGKLATRYNDCPTAFVAERHGHSEKPAAFYDMVERMSPGPYLDVFARKQRFNWDTWGNESFDFREHGIWHKEPTS